MQHFLEEFQLTKTLFLCFKNAFTLKQIKKKTILHETVQCARWPMSTKHTDYTSKDTRDKRHNPRLVFRKPNNLDFHMALPPTL